MRFVKRIIERPVSVVMLILAVVVFGTSSLTGMPLEYMPDMEMPMEMVMVTWAGADADSMDRLVTQVIEDKCESLSNVDSISSVSNDNYAMVILSYNYGTDLDEAYSDLRSAMDMVMMELPSGCDEPTILEMGSNSSASIMASVSAPEGLDLDSYLDDTVIPALESLGGVAQVEVMGSRNDYIRIVLDEAAMKQYGLSITDIGSAIATADFDMPVGDVTLGTQDIALGVYGSVDTDMESLRSLPVKTPSGQTVKLSDVTTFVDFYEEEAESVSRYNGNSTVMLSITKEDSAVAVNVCRSITRTLDRYSVDGVEFQIIYNEGDSILDTLGEVLQTLVIGVICTMLVLLLFFGDFRASLIVGLSMPLSILLAMICLNYGGFSLDLMTGSGLIIAIGMIVDNSIVVMESCMRFRSQGLDIKEAAIQGTSTMLMSILAGTLTTVVVYIPLAMLEGMSGQMAGPLCWTIMLTLICSFFSAVVVVPLAYVWIKPRAREDLPINRLLARARNGYRRVLPGLLIHPGRVVAVGFACFLAAILLLTRMDMVMMANNYDGSITMEVTFRSGTKLEVMDERITELESALMEDGNFEKVILQLSDNTASFTVYAVDGCKRTSEEAVEEYTARFGGTPGMDISVSPTSSGSSMGSMMSGNSKDIKLVGDDLDALREAADLVEEAMTRVPGVISVENDFAQSRVKGRVVVDSQKALAAGTTEAGVATQISYLLGGMTATTLENGDTEYDVVVEYPEGKYESITDLLEYPITTQSGQIITLGDIAEVEYVTTLPSISREDGRYTATITATTTSTGKSSASAQIDAAVRELDFPEGVSTAMTMLDENTGEQTSSLGSAIAAAIFLVFLVMAIQFESPKLSLMVMMCIPLSLIGSIGLLFICGRDMSMTGMMGILMLAGISVNNGIYLIDGITALRKTLPLGEALVEAGTTRLRPILMTTITTVASMLPMMFSADSGMSMTKDMSYIVVGGLIASTVLAMFLMPAFYLLIRGENLDGGRRRGLFRRFRARRDGGADDTTALKQRNTSKEGTSHGT